MPARLITRLPWVHRCSMNPPLVVIMNTIYHGIVSIAKCWDTISVDFCKHLLLWVQDLLLNERISFEDVGLAMNIKLSLCCFSGDLICYYGTLVWGVPKQYVSVSSVLFLNCFLRHKYNSYRFVFDSLFNFWSWRSWRGSSTQRVSFIRTGDVTVPEMSE